ncbi:MAG TPA: ferredoxin reductase [Marmoricola sp.]
MAVLERTLTERVLASKTLAALATPHTVDRYLELVNPMWAATEVRARIVDIHRENPDSEGAEVATLTLQPTRTWRGHRAGQYVQVGVELPGSAKRLTRCFSISSAASAPGERFTLTIRAHEEGQVSKFLVRDAKPGQILHLGQAEGEFTLTESPATPTVVNRLLYITGGSGITPAMSMVRTLLRDGYDGHAGRKVSFVHFARSPEDQIFAEELKQIAAADNGVDVHLFYGDDTFSAIRLAQIVPDFRNTDTWCCGPAPMVELVEAAYDGSSRLRLEFFKPPRTASGEAGGEVSFAKADKTVANDGTSLLEQAEAAGLTPEFGCRMGICFSCTARKCEGTVRNVLTGEESSLPDEDIRICVSAPVGDCVVDL